ncbi:serine protease Do-like HtrB isoform X1 [Lolium rigidum]|uniref:serine protease Do-like HtrB isoform X1 n=1 Tax=Lolium rigidum TaxID=89674 RepID=UPI001F5C85AC|nr:serine protease Do-like HtrB isoform X1 [Lolium rigidum]
MPSENGGSRSPSQAPSSERSDRKRKAEEESSTEAAGMRIGEDGEETKKRRKDEDGDEEETKKKRKDEDGDEEETKKKRGDEAGDENGDEEVVSSAPSSPLYEPRLPEDDPDPPPELIEAFERAQSNYEIKRDRHEDLVTIEYCRSSHMFFNPELLPVAEPATKAVLLAARFVVGLSSSFEGARKRCSGFWIKFDKNNKTGFVLTTAHLFSSKGCSVEQKGEGVEDEYAAYGEVKYYPDAKVTVHLPDGSTRVGQLIYHQEHYDLAFFSVSVDQSVDQWVQSPLYNDGVKWGELVFWLGRDAKFNLTMTHLRPGYMNPNTFERPHYMFFPGKEHIIKYDNGGPIIDLEGKIVGMVNSHRSGSFIPSSVLLKCLDLWNEFGCIPRPQLGLAFSGIKLLDIVQVEKIWRNYKIDDGLIANEVLKGSPAEEIGIRRGDIIECLNGECISTTVQLENLLLSLCKSAGKGLDSEIHVSVGVFHVRKLRRKTREFTVGVSERLEFIDKAYKLVTLEEGTCAASSST